MPTNEERREVAARLRELPCIPSELDQWKGRELFLEPSRYDEADYAQIHRILLGCFPADIMHPCDYEDLHTRLADLIEPEERTCHDVSFDSREFVCSWCGCHIDVLDIESEPTMWLGGSPIEPSFCPNCGAKVVDQ
ncbi:MAG: hypothetical protein ACLT5H_02075 [Collinsella stercoris]|uniref:hypothetical protein n=1 Tax=Collinsella stercoris TaxID=147206 RepID=UPI003994662D